MNHQSKYIMEMLQLLRHPGSDLINRGELFSDSVSCIHFELYGALEEGRGLVGDQRDQTCQT